MNRHGYSFDADSVKRQTLPRLTETVDNHEAEVNEEDQLAADHKKHFSA